MIAFGTIIGHGLCTAGAVLGGRYLSTKISVKHSTLLELLKIKCYSADRTSLSHWGVRVLCLRVFILLRSVDQSCGGCCRGIKSTSIIISYRSQCRCRHKALASELSITALAPDDHKRNRVDLIPVETASKVNHYVREAMGREQVGDRAFRPDLMMVPRLIDIVRWIF